MITRYDVNFQERMIEPGENGKWIKYADHQQIEMLVDIKVEEIVSERLKAERALFETNKAEMAVLKADKDALEIELAALREYTDKMIVNQDKLIRAAKDRLDLLGHSPVCDSRYKRIQPDGQTDTGKCTCGLSDWMKETGLRG